MTNDGFSRLASLFLNDIASIRYDVDGTEQTSTSYTSSIIDNRLTLFLSIPDTPNGLFDNFRIIGSTGITYTERNINFTKVSDGLIIDIPFIFVNG